MLPLHRHSGPPHTRCVSEDWASAQTLCEQLARGSSAPDTHLDLTCALPVASPGSQSLFLVTEPAPSAGSFGPVRVCLQSLKQRVFPSPSFSSVPLLLPGQGSVFLPSTGHKALGLVQVLTGHSCGPAEKRAQRSPPGVWSQRESSSSAFSRQQTEKLTDRASPLGQKSSSVVPRTGM